MDLRADRSRRWLGLLWTLVVCADAHIATFCFVEGRSAAIVVKFNEEGDKDTVFSIVADHLKHFLLPSFQISLPYFAFVAAVSWAIYHALERGKSGRVSLWIRILLGWLVVLFPMLTTPNGNYLMTCMWAATVIPASHDQFQGWKWRVVETAAFFAVSSIATTFSIA